MPRKKYNPTLEPQRNFQIPGCTVLIHNRESEPIDINQLLGIVFGLAGANPDALVKFHIELIPEPIECDDDESCADAVFD
jgi:hypothetical protein